MLAATSAVRGQSPAAKADTSPDTTTVISYGAFVDSYYAYDFSRPVSLDRSFTTQAARHNEFNINLAFIEAKVSGPRIRGRLALQAGTSVQANYAGEPTIGAVSGPGLSRFIQEAVAGFRLSSALWVEGGIFFSHIGTESFVSRDNLTYTRSLSAEYTPYYESGARLTWEPKRGVTAVLVVINGWQNISESNTDKAVGLRLDLARGKSTTLSYYNFAGNEDATGDLLRVFNGIAIKSSAFTGVALQANADYGFQEQDDGGRSRWYSAGLVAKVQPTPSLGVSARIERYVDSDQVIVVTSTDDGFAGTMASLGFDLSPIASMRAVWRNELRGTWTDSPIFPSRSTTGPSRSNYLIVTSLAVTF